MQLFLNISFAVVMLLLPLYFIKWPAKQVNDLKGYRTRRSQQNQQSWNFAQKYWPQILLRLTLPLVVIQFVLGNFMDNGIAVLITAFIWILFIMTSAWLTEVNSGSYSAGTIS